MTAQPYTTFQIRGLGQSRELQKPNFRVSTEGFCVSALRAPPVRLTIVDDLGIFFGRTDLLILKTLARCLIQGSL